MALALAVRPGTDASEAKIAKVTDVRDRMGAVMHIATDGLGAITASDEVFIVEIEPPPNGVADDSDTNAFARDVANLVYEQTGDDWDFVAVYADYGTPTVGSRYIRARNDTTKVGYGLWDGTEAFGSDGRLMGVGLVDDVARLPGSTEHADGDVQLLLHETIGHQYGVYHPQINRGGIHFALGLESPCFTVMYGRPWRKIDETHFKCEQADNPTTGMLDIKFHPWMMYIMGLKRRSEVPAQLMKVTLDELPEHRYSQYETTGTYEMVTMTQLFGPPAAGDIPRPAVSLSLNRGVLVKPNPLDQTEQLQPVRRMPIPTLERKPPKLGPVRAQ